jgi:diguanylate cyclase (GGDEF)-like protein
LVGPLTLLSVFLLAVLGLATVLLIRGFDLKATQREQALVSNGIEGRIAEVGGIVVPQAVWGEAVRKLDHGFDKTWAQTYVLSFLADTGGFDSIHIVDAQNRFLIGQIDGRPASAAEYRAVATQAQAVISQIRAAEDRRVSLNTTRNHFDKSPVQASALVAIGQKNYILTATRVQPDDTDHQLRGPHGPVILAAIRIDEAFLGQFAERYLLRDLAVHDASTPALDGLAVAPLIDDNGRTIGHLSWYPQNPGAALFTKLAPGLAIMAVLILALAVRLIGQSHRNAQNLIASEARAAHLAYHDSLTGLANRVQFNDQLHRALRQQQRGGNLVTVLCIDLDRFKEVNDAFGHGVGDLLLKEAARRMTSQCRAEDFLARLSGDEFAIIKRGGTASDAFALAERVTQEVCRPFLSGATQLHVGCSIGIAVSSTAGLDSAELLRQADIALYRAKGSGRGGYCFFETEMDVATKSRAAVAADLREAIGRGELRLAYQPQSDMHGNLTGLEALLRWYHPVRGEVGPSYFIPIAEQSGLIKQLGRFALRQAFIDSKRWPRLTVSINISANQIRDEKFVAELAALIDEHEIDPARFDLEITEGILLDDEPEIKERLSQIRRMGIGLALDDFGTGYSSLSYLHRYPITKIKIDRSFVANLGIEPQASAVVDAIVRLARALHLQVIAEGVESASQLNQLIASGCNQIQGYLLSEPVDADAITAMQGRRILLSPAKGLAA